MQFYAESKILAEKAALHFGKENPSITVVSIVLPIVAGTSMTNTAPFSMHMVLSLITGRHMYVILVSRGRGRGRDRDRDSIEEIVIYIGCFIYNL